jgi:ATP-binding cassette subfamily B protein
MPTVNIVNHTSILCFLMVARHFHLDFTLDGILHKYALQDAEVPCLFCCASQGAWFPAKEAA